MVLNTDFSIFLECKKEKQHNVHFKEREDRILSNIVRLVGVVRPGRGVLQREVAARADHQQVRRGGPRVLHQVNIVRIVF